MRDSYEYSAKVYKINLLAPLKATSSNPMTGIITRDPGTRPVTPASMLQVVAHCSLGVH